MSNNVFTPVVDAEEVYGDGDWRPILGEAQRKNNWRLYMIGKQSIEHRLTGFLLPSFDFTLSLDDQSFGTSVAPCWTSTADKRLPRHFVPNAFALPVLMYPYLGEKMEHWISPYNRRNMIGNDSTDPEEFADAFDDLNKWVRRNKQISQEDKDRLLKAESMKDDPVIPGRTIRYFSLAECTEKDAQEPHLGLVGYTASSYSYLLEQMRWRHEDEGEPRDPDFPRYLLGDPTNPNAALQWHCDKILLDAKDTHDTNVMCFTRRREYLDDDTVTKVIDKDTLAKRFLLPDPTNWNIPTYEDQVHHMIEHFDPLVTIEMIQAACSHRYRGEIPSSRPKSVVYSQPSGNSAEQSQPQGATSRESARSTAPTPDPVAAVTGGLAPTSSAPVPEPEPEPAAPTSDKSYWAGPAGGKPTKMTVAELQGVYDAGEAAGYKVTVDGQNWLNLEDSNLIELKKVEEAPPSVPTDDAPPSVPTDDAPPSVPTDPAPPEVPASDSPNLSRDELKARMFPDAAALAAMPAEKQAEIDKLVTEAHAVTKGDQLQDIPQEIVERMLALIG